MVAETETETGRGPEVVIPDGTVITEYNAALWVHVSENGIDALLPGGGRTLAAAKLREWAQTTPELHEFVLDYHRLQLEHWVWSHLEVLRDRDVMDVGIWVGQPRRYFGKGYFTFGLDEGDVRGDLTRLTQVVPPGSLDGIICTEVMEHCYDPFAAVREMHAALKPGGLLLVSAPFFWPDHKTQDFPDLWRFTIQGWIVLLSKVAGFSKLDVQKFAWTDEGLVLYDFMRRFEAFGFESHVEAATGYMVEAVK